MESLSMRDVWKYAMRDGGVQFVAEVGITVMPRLFAVS